MIRRKEHDKKGKSAHDAFLPPRLLGSECGELIEGHPLLVMFSGQRARCLTRLASFVGGILGGMMPVVRGLSVIWRDGS